MFHNTRQELMDEMKGTHIVLVEDDLKLSALLTSYLEQQQLIVTQIHDGADAQASIVCILMMLITHSHRC